MKRMFLISGPIPTYETVWLIGDKFITDSAGEHFQWQDSDEGFYLKDKYTVKIYNRNNFSLTTSVMARIHNNFIRVIKENTIFPKAVLFVLDGDFLKTVAFNNYRISEVYGQVLKNLMVGIHHVILA